MYSNYPPGVTGQESQIAGPSKEIEDQETRYCETCEEETVHDVYIAIYEYDGITNYLFTCKECDTEIERNSYDD